MYDLKPGDVIIVKEHLMDDSAAEAECPDCFDIMGWDRDMPIYAGKVLTIKSRVRDLHSPCGAYWVDVAENYWAWTTCWFTPLKTGDPDWEV